MATTLMGLSSAPGPQPVDTATTAPADGGDGRRSLGSARLAVRGLLGAARAELRELQPVRVVATVLLGDVVAVLAVHARHRDLGTDVGALACHGGNLLSKLKGELNWT